MIALPRQHIVLVHFFRIILILTYLNPNISVHSHHRILVFFSSLSPPPPLSLVLPLLFSREKWQSPRVQPAPLWANNYCETMDSSWGYPAQCAENPRIVHNISDNFLPYLHICRCCCCLCPLLYSTRSVNLTEHIICHIFNQEVVEELPRIFATAPAKSYVFSCPVGWSIRGFFLPLHPPRTLHINPPSALKAE